MTQQQREKCPNCGGDIAVRNPSGHCDHLYYPENIGTPTPNPRDHGGDPNGKADSNSDGITLCSHCLSMTHTVNGRCGKCHHIRDLTKNVGTTKVTTDARIDADNVTTNPSDQSGDTTQKTDSNPSEWRPYVESTDLVRDILLAVHDEFLDHELCHYDIGCVITSEPLIMKVESLLASSQMRAEEKVWKRANEMLKPLSAELKEFLEDK